MSNLHLLAAEGANSFFLAADHNELIWGTLSFLIVLGLLIWKAGPAIKTAMSARTERLAKELDDATEARTDAQAKLADVQHRIADAANERQRILDEATQTADSLKAQLRTRADQ